MEGSKDNPVVIVDQCSTRRKSARIINTCPAAENANATDNAASSSKKKTETKRLSKAVKNKGQVSKKRAANEAETPKKRAKQQPETPKKRVKKEVQAPKKGKERETVSFATDEEKALLKKLRGKIERARGQRMYVVSRELEKPHSQAFGVLGSTGNVYNVHIGTKLSCDCQDFFYGYRHAGPRHCKHILMVLIKVFRLEATSKAYRTTTLSMKMVDDIFSRNALPDPSAIACEALQSAVQAKLSSASHSEDGVKRRSLDTADCPICFEEFEGEKIATVLFCNTCGNNVHKECFEAWKKSTRSTPNCVYCRTEWVDESKKKVNPKFLNKEGYINLAEVAEISNKRDTNTYRQFPGPSVWRRPN